jgi:mRNA interferase MazF
MAAYVPVQGDLVVLTFDPQAGHEQMGRRPAICCPITNTRRDTPFHVPVPDHCGLTGYVMCEQMKSIDYRARRAKKIGSAPRELLDEVLSVVDASIFPESR